MSAIIFRICKTFMKNQVYGDAVRIAGDMVNSSAARVPQLSEHAFGIISNT